MKHTSLLIAAVVFTSSPALASGKCSTAPQSKWQPQPKLEAQLLSDGFKVRQIKVERGCYEVYATDKDGKRYELRYESDGSPITLRRVKRTRAGRPVISPFD